MPMPVIRKHKRGNFYMNATFAGKRETIYGKTEEEVEQKYIRKSYEYGMGIKVGQKTQLGDYMRSWLALRKEDLSPYTYVGYKGNIENHIIPAFGKKNVQDLLPADIQGLYTQKRKERKAAPLEKQKLDEAEAAMKAAKTEQEKTVAKAAVDAVDKKLAAIKPLSETSLLYIHRILSAALNDAVKNRMILTNPAMAVKQPKARKVKKTPPAEDGVRRLFSSVRGKEYELGVHLAVACGLRRGEICAVQWDDMDWERNMLTVDKALVQTAEVGTIVKPPKNDDPREVFVPDGLVALMKKEQKRQQFNAEFLGRAYQQNGYMVRHSDGTPFTPYSMSMSINHAIKREGITSTLHGLRGAFVSLGYKLGADEKAITDAAGHHSVEFNRARYQTVYDTMKEDFAGMMDKALYDESSEGETDS